jgi:hypothetical protein
MEFGNLRLHTFASNDPNVMSAFPSDDLATSLKDLDLESDMAHMSVVFSTFQCPSECFSKYPTR